MEAPSKNILKQLINKFLRQAMVETKSDELSLSTLRVFLLIPDTDEGISQTSVVQAMKDVSNTTVSRHVAFLAGLDSRRKSPLPEPLIITTHDPVDRRYKYLKLTNAGKQLQDKLVGDFLNQLT